jgi:hypothetical protein
MNFPICSGEQIIAYLRDSQISQDTTVPFMANVLRVNRGSIVIAEPDSHNGLGSICINGVSRVKGWYWYEYIDKNLTGRSFNVVELRNKDGEIVKTDKFIKEN